MMYNNCNECPRHNTDACPFAGRPEEIRQACQFLRLKLSPLHEDPLKRIAELLFPEHRPMDYNRNDTKGIANNWKPDNN